MTFERLEDFIVAENARLKQAYAGSYSPDSWLLRQGVKLSEEVGELSDQILGHLNLQRAAKAHKYNPDELAGEMADVVIMALLVGAEAGLDLGAVLEAKIAFIEARYA